MRNGTSTVRVKDDEAVVNKIKYEDTFLFLSVETFNTPQLIEAIPFHAYQ
jgi:hypothetical protein